MSNVPESASYDAGIYQLETVDEVLGGVNGKANAQAKGLANRTNWLKQQVDALNTSKGKGVAAFSAANSYVGGDQVIYQKNIWVANTTISPGAWNATQWTKQLGTAAASELADALPLMDGAAATGTSTDLAREDHVHPTDTSRAPLSSPAFTDNPSAPTPPQFDNDSSLMTTAFAKRMGVELSGLNSISSSTVLTNASIGGLVSASSAAPINVTLPPTGGVAHGAVIMLANAGTGAVTLLASGSEVTTNQSGSTVSIVLGFGDTAMLVKVTGEWRLEGGSVALKYAAIMAGANWTTPPQFDSSKKLATMEAVQRALGSHSKIISVISSAALDSASIGALVWCADIGPYAVTLPVLSTLTTPAGSRITIYCSANVATIQRGSTDNILVNDIGVTSLTLSKGDTLTLVSAPDSGVWVAEAGSAQLGYSSSFGSSLAASGYQKLPSGLIIQWGSGSYINGQTVNFPIVFPNACRSLNISTDGSQTANIELASFGSITTSGFVSYLVQQAMAGGSWTSLNGAVSWISIGH